MNSTHNDQHDKNNVTGVSTPKVKQHTDKLHQTLTVKHPICPVISLSERMYKAGECIQPEVMSLIKDVHDRAIHPSCSRILISARMNNAGQCILPEVMPLRKDVKGRAIQPSCLVILISARMYIYKG